MSALIILIVGLICSIIGLCVAKNRSMKLNDGQWPVPLEEHKLLMHDEHADITLTADDGSIVEIHYINYYRYWLDEFGNEICDPEDPFSRTYVEIVRKKGDEVLYHYTRKINID